jgi:tRNA-2-methylthio-N6-dimethylallyladenosine synthase
MSDAPIDAHGSIDKLMPQLHLPVQSGSNKILKAMNRRHTYEKYLEIIDKLRQTRADMCFSSDIIVGYPGETEKDFQDTIAIIKEVKFAQVYSFKYSPRPGTPAAELPQLPEEIKTERLRQLQALTRVHQDEFNAMSLDKNLDVLITNKGKRPGQVTGFSQYLQSVVIDDGAKHIGNIVRVKIIKILSNTLKGEVI